MRVIYVEEKKTKKPEYLSPVVNAHFLCTNQSIYFKFALIITSRGIRRRKLTIMIIMMELS